MRHASLVLALAFVFLAAGCGNSRNTGQEDDAGAQDANQFDLSPQQDAPPQTDVGPQRDAPPANFDSGTSLILCGATYCNYANGEECCVTGTGVECQAVTTCAGYGTLRCDGPEDCYEAAKPICCGRIGTSGGGTACDSTCTGNGAMPLCHVDGDCDTGQKCCGALQAFGINIQYCLAETDCSSGPTEGVPCNGSPCLAPNACCMTMSGGTCGTIASCTAGVPVSCDGPEDCQQDGGTQVCCADVQISSGGVTGGATCAAACNPTGIVGGVLCHSNADCESPKTCKSAGYGGFTFHICQN
jgi:hypothetical protein